MANLKKEILNLLDKKVNEIFVEIQDREGITSGDIEPFDAVELDELEEHMASLIAKVISYEKRN